jgi:CBS domain-containing protein
MKVKEVMVAEVKSCSPNDALNRAAQIMWESDCGCLPVIDVHSTVVGMLTDRDICMAAYTQGATLSGIPVSGAMSREVFSCRSGDDLLAAQRIMREHRVRRLPVTDAQRKLVGILSLNDMARGLARTAAGKTQIAGTLAAICTPYRGEAQSKPLQGERRERSSRGERRGGTRQSKPPTERPPG